MYLARRLGSSQDAEHVEYLPDDGVRADPEVPGGRVHLDVVDAGVQVLCLVTEVHYLLLR